MSSPTPNIRTSEIVRAGAGAGKTTDLVEKICRFCSDFSQETGRYPRIVVTTFTRKATQELRERLILKALEREDQQLLATVTSPSHVFISTIHGVLRQFLSRHGSEIGLVPNFQLIADAEDLTDRKRRLKEILLGQFRFQSFMEDETTESLLGLLEDSYAALLTNPDLRSLDRQSIAESLERKTDEMRGRLAEASNDILRQTDHEGWSKFAVEMANLAQVSEGFTSALRSWREGTSKPQNRGKVKPLGEDMAQEISQLWKDIRDYVEMPDWRDGFVDDVCDRSDLFLQLSKQWAIEYTKFKVETGMLRQSDLELLSLELLRSSPHSGQQFAKSWDHWFIDEYQDTSPVQVSLFDQLTVGAPVYIVGDPQQSIYLFRGARSEVFDQKWQSFAAAGYQTRTKMINYRSEPELMSCLNDVVTKMSSQFSPMELKGPVENVREVAYIYTADDPQQETQSVVQRVRELLSEGVAPAQIAVLTRKRSQIRHLALALNKAAIPYQTFVPSGFFDRMEVIDALGLLKFLCQPHDDENLIGLLRSPWYRVGDPEIYRLCHRIFEDETEMGTNPDKGKSRPASLWSYVLSLPDCPEALTRLEEWSNAAKSEGIGRTWQRALCEDGLLDSCAHHDLSGRREANLWKLVSKLRGLEGKPGFRYLDFVGQNLTDFSEDGAAEESEAVAAFEPDRVHLMTAHKSKGLQFDHILIPYAGEPPRTSPHGAIARTESQLALPLVVDVQGVAKKVRPYWSTEIRDQLNRRELEENERLLYVALTRAKRSVTVTWSQVSKKSWAEYLRASTHGLESDLYSIVRVEEPVEVVASGPSESTPAEDVRPLFFDVEGEPRVQMSVTDTVSASKLTQSAPKSLGLIQRVEKIHYGILSHRLFEALQSQPIQVVKKMVSSWPRDPREKAEHSLDYLTSLTEIPLFDLLREGFSEWGFSFQYGEGTSREQLNGQIDLWGCVGGVTYIVDYKTGSSARRKEAFEQMSHYARCLRLGGYVQTRDIALVAIYPVEGVLFRQDIKVSAEDDTSIDLM